MDDFDDEVFERAVHRGESMDYGDFFDFVERFHDDGRPGVSRDALAAYAEELTSRRDFSFDAGGFLDAVDERATDAETWAGPDRFYLLEDDRLSKFPARWHDRLGGSTDVAEYLRFVQDETEGFLEDLAKTGAGAGVPEDTLLHMIEVLGRVDHEGATEALSRARHEGEVVEELDQHPQTDVYLADRNPERGDQSVRKDR